MIDWRLDAIKIMGTGQCNAVISLLLRWGPTGGEGVEYMGQ